MPEWSKGVDLRSTVFARVGSNPTFGNGEHGYGEHGYGEHGLKVYNRFIKGL